MLVSPDTITPGQPSVVVTSSSPGFQSLNVQALAGSGHATLSFASPGFQTATLPVTLTPAGAAFQDQPLELGALTNSGVLQQAVYLASLDPVTLQPGQGQSPRPGTNLSVTVTSSNPKILQITTPTAQFPPPALENPAAPYAGIQPVAPGSAIVSLGAVAGNPIPASGNQIVFSVTEPQLSIFPFTLGVDLQTPVQLTLANSAVNKSADTIISVGAQYPIQLSLNPTNPGQGSIAVTVPAGQTLSKPFYVQALGGGTGELSYGGGTFPNYVTSVTVTQTAFVIQEAATGQPIGLTTGGTANLTIVPALSSPSTTASGQLSIRPGAKPILIAVASTNPSVATTNPSQVTFNPGDQRHTFSVEGVSAGNATVKLLGVTYDFGLPQASIQVVVK